MDATLTSDDDDSSNDALGRIVRNIARTTSAGQFSALNSTAWFKSTIPTPIELGLINQTYAKLDNHQWFANVLPHPSTIDFISDVFKQVNAHRFLNDIVPRVDTLSWLTNVYPKVNTLAWMDKVQSTMTSSVVAQIAGARIDQQEWWKGVYSGVDWQGISSTVQISSLNKISQAITQTGAALATSLSDEVIESILTEFHDNTELAEPEHDDAQATTDSDTDTADVEDPILEAVLRRLAGFSTWWQDHYPELSSRVITELNIASRSVVYTFVMYSLPTYLVHFFGTEGIAMSSVLLGLAHFHSERSKKKLSPANAAAIDFECPYCKAQPGMQCITISGDNIGSPTKIHSGRLYLA